MCLVSRGFAVPRRRGRRGYNGLRDGRLFSGVSLLKFSVVFGVAALVVAAAVGWSAAPPSNVEPFEQSFSFDGEWARSWTLAEGQALEVHVRVDDPEALPANGRIAVRWDGPGLDDWAFEGERGDLHSTATVAWRKVLHELDADVYVVYRAPVAGSYRLTLETVTCRA